MRETVARIVKEEGRDNFWGCALCTYRGEFLSLMIAHIFVHHSVKSVTASEDTTEVLGIVER